MGKNYSFSLRKEKKTKGMCFHQRGENAMNIIKRYKDVAPTWKDKKILAQWAGLAPGQGHLSSGDSRIFF